MSKSFFLPVALGLLALAARAAVPTTKLYPFAGAELTAIRAKTKAEARPPTADLQAAWRLYEELEGAWAPGALPPRKAALAELDRLQDRLEALPKPGWFRDAMNSPQSGRAQLADAIGDETFERQRATPGYQALKALAIVYLAEHEVDRAGAAQKAGQCLMVLSITHPWDWEVHGLYSRLLLDARLNGPAWMAAQESLFLNPAPSQEDMKFFAFIGSVAARQEWPEIKEAIRQAATDPEEAEVAIADSARLFSTDAKVKVVPPKKP